MSERGEKEALTGEPDRRRKRRAAMLAAARALFLERGYDAVSVAEIVRHSGGSLSTFYDLFVNKPGLLGALVAQERFIEIGEIDAIIARQDPPPATLHAIAESLYHDFLHAERIGMMRIVMAETLRDQAVAQVVYDSAHAPTVDRLADLFACWTAQGYAHFRHPALAAQFFLGMVVHGAQMRALFGDACQRPVPPPELVIEEAVALFLTGYGITAHG